MNTEKLFILLIIITVITSGVILLINSNQGYDDFGQEASFEVDQILIKILIKEGKSTQTELRVTNLLERDQEISINLENLDELLEIDNDEFTLKSGQTKIVNLNFTTFNDYEKIFFNPDIYIGKLIVHSKTYTEEIPVILEIESKNVWFDMNLQTIKKNREIVQGQDGIIEVRIYNLIGKEPINVDLEYSVRDLDNHIIITETETAVIESQTSFFKTMKFPKNIRPEAYVFTGKVEYGDSVGTSSYLFEIIPEQDEATDLRQILAIVFPALLILTVLVGALLLIKPLAESRKEKPVIVDLYSEKKEEPPKLLEPSEAAERILKAKPKPEPKPQKLEIIKTKELKQKPPQKIVEPFKLFPKKPPKIKKPKPEKIRSTMEQIKSKIMAKPDMIKEYVNSIKNDNMSQDEVMKGLESMRQKIDLVKKKVDDVKRKLEDERMSV